MPKYKRLSFNETSHLPNDITQKKMFGRQETVTDAHGTIKHIVYYLIYQLDYM